jgi:hypothetical protein
MAWTARRSRAITAPFSYWHGWRNGMVDGGHRPKDAAQAALAHDYLAQAKARKTG